MTEAKPLHLPDLYIEGFRGIDKLTIPRLGRVTLLAGKNGIGKTTVLDAVRVYAARGSHAALYELLVGNEEVSYDGEDESVPIPDVSALFYERNSRPSGCEIVIGPYSHNSRLYMDLASSSEIWEYIQGGLQSRSFEHWDTLDIQAVKVKFQSSNQIIPLGFPSDRRPRQRRSVNGSEIKCTTIGPDILDTRDVARFWDNVALYDDERLAIDSLKLIAGDDIDRIAVVGENSPGFGRKRRRLMVKLKGHRRPVPLRSLGDGAMRMFGVALALANSRDGFLLLDEAENGIHHTLQRDFWRMALQTAQANNVQVLATTHSWDCVVGFARAAIECEEAEGILYRLSRRYGDLRAVYYPEKELKIAAEQRIEVR